MSVVKSPIIAETNEETVTIHETINKIGCQVAMDGTVWMVL